eukprot:gene26150-11875_t
MRDIATMTRIKAVHKFQPALLHAREAVGSNDSGLHLSGGEAERNEGNLVTIVQCGTARKKATSEVPEAPPPKLDDDDSGSAAESGSDQDGDGGKETKGQMAQRHKKEELAALTKEIEDRHTKELKDLEEGAASLPDATAALSLDEVQGTTSKPEPATAEDKAEEGEKAGGMTKAMKRKAKLAKEESEREARIAAEKEALGPSDRVVEEEQLAELLRPMGLMMRDIRQQQQSGACTRTPEKSFLDLRSMAAARIRGNMDEFIPFVYDDAEPGEPAEQLEAYCEKLESTAVWGGQLELQALSQSLKREIKVFTVCYMRHAFGLGEHYNSLENIKSCT